VNPAKTGVSCQVCGKQRDAGAIHARQSKLLKQVKNLLICTKCEAEKMEPRAFIIIVAKSKGVEAVADYIDNDRYHGPPIIAKEIARKL